MMCICTMSAENTGAHGTRITSPCFPVGVYETSTASTELKV